LKVILIDINGNVYGKNVVGEHSKMITEDYIGGNKFKKSEKNT
tara:strand:+ start:970 stop:1098 length:129 start_codon:yes stop_codon:yes gene_type:complete